MVMVHFSLSSMRYIIGLKDDNDMMNIMMMMYLASSVNRRVVRAPRVK